MSNHERFLSRGASLMQESAIRRMGNVGGRVADLISFAPGYPAPELFAWPECRDIASRLLEGSDPSVLQYGPTRGFPPLLDAFGEILAERGITATREETIVTTGSQQGLDLTARVFIDPGDAVLVELPTYTGALTAFRNAQGRLVGVPQDGDGVDVDALDRALMAERSGGRRVAFAYVVPNFQNPTGQLVSLVKRRALLEWASRRDVLLVEDDPYGALYFEDVATAAETRSIKADDREGRVVYMSSVSKTVAPGFRVAWIAAAAPLVAKMEVAKQAVDLCTGGLDQRIVCELWKSGALRSRLPLLRAFYQKKRTVMEQALRRELGVRAVWSQPKGGFFLWVELPEPIDAEALLERCTPRGVVYVAGSAFFVDGRTSRFARLSFAAPTPDRIEEGIRRIGAAVNEEMATGSPLPSAASAER